MSKARQINKVEVDVWDDGIVWLHVFWKGKPRYVTDKGDEICNRNHHSSNPKRIRRLLKRGRQMQDIIIARWNLEAQ
jgi:hypothetical protein